MMPPGPERDFVEMVVTIAVVFAVTLCGVLVARVVLRALLP